MSLSPDTVAIINAVKDLTGNIEKKMLEIEATQERILSGFPDGDPDMHRRIHESSLEWRELRNSLMREALGKAASAGAFVAVGWIAYALWVAFKMELVK